MSLLHGNTFTPEVVNQTIDARDDSADRPERQMARDLQTSRSTRPVSIQVKPAEGGNDAFVTSGLESTTPTTRHDQLGEQCRRLPSISVTLPDGSDTRMTWRGTAEQ